MCIECAVSLPCHIVLLNLLERRVAPITIETDERKET